MSKTDSGFYESSLSRCVGLSCEIGGIPPYFNLFDLLFRDTEKVVLQVVHGGEELESLRWSGLMTNFEQLIVQNILQSLPVGLAVINPEGEIVVANAALCDTLGYEREELVSTGWGLLFFHADKNIEFNQVLIDVIREEKMHLVRSVYYERPDGTRLRLSITSSFLRDGDSVAGIVLLMQDTTEKHNMHLREKRVLEERSRIREERGEGLRKLALSVAHQIRNPVMGIGGLAGLASRKAVDTPSIVHYLDGIREECLKLEQIVGAVSRFASLPQPTPRRMSVAGVVEDARLFLEEKAAELGLEFEWKKDVDICSVFADSHLLESALHELLVNALESGREIPVRGKGGESTHTYEKVAIFVTVHNDDDKWTYFTVQDNGRGIAEENIPYLFDPFYTTKTVGVGMGLAVVRRIVTELGGNIQVQSIPGKGSTFVIKLPSHDPESDACPVDGSSDADTKVLL